MELPINTEFIKTYISSHKQHQHNIIDFFKNWTTAKLIEIKSVENNYIKIIYDYYINVHHEESKNDTFNKPNQKIFTYNTTTLNENKHVIKFIPMKEHIDIAIKGKINISTHSDNYYCCCKCKKSIFNRCFNHINTLPFVGDVDVNVNVNVNVNVCRCNNVYYSKIEPNSQANSTTYMCVNCHTDNSDFIEEKIKPHPNYYSKEYINDHDNNKITQIFKNCSVYYQVLYEYNDSTHIFHYLNSCCGGDDLLFSESPNLDDVINMIKQCQRNDLNYKLLKKICYSVE